MEVLTDGRLNKNDIDEMSEGNYVLVREIYWLSKRVPNEDLQDIVDIRNFLCCVDEKTSRIEQIVSAETLLDAYKISDGDTDIMQYWAEVAIDKCNSDNLDVENAMKEVIDEVKENGFFAIYQKQDIDPADSFD